jgi:protein gp37
MSDRSAIEWCDASWNPVTGCDRKSPGCANCYALELAPRLRAMGVPKYANARDGGRAPGPAFGVTLHPDELDRPQRWRRPRRIFVNSMSDLFHEQIPFEFVDLVFATMAVCPWHTFQVLTKRPERMLAYCEQRYEQLAGELDGLGAVAAVPWPNVWLGVSVENRRWAWRVDVLRDVPAVVRFVSAEPLLGSLAGLDLTAVDWLIVGGESGPRRRPVRAAWVRELRDMALAVGVAFFFKQWGGQTPAAGGRLLDGREWAQFPPMRVPVAEAKETAA